MWSADVVVVNGSSHTCFNSSDRLPKCCFYNRSVARVYFDFHHISSRANEPDRIFRTIRALCVLFAWERRALSPRCEMLYAKREGEKNCVGKIRSENGMRRVESGKRQWVSFSCEKSFELFELAFSAAISGDFTCALLFWVCFLCEGILIVKSCGKWSGAAESSAEEGKSMKSQECA